jgi:hypothetical protein
MHSMSAASSGAEKSAQVLSCLVKFVHEYSMSSLHFIFSWVLSLSNCQFVKHLIRLIGGGLAPLNQTVFTLIENTLASKAI